jgi:predicted nuclease of predicted toxin-antitoxin system
MKLLIDECLSPELAKVAHELGHGESSHVVWLKKSGWKDWQLKPIILNGDWTFVTRDAIDFRGPDAKRGSEGQYADVQLHAGLICLDAAGVMDLDMQLRLFKEALAEVGDGDLINQVLEIYLTEEGDLHIVRYRLPSC